MSTYTFISKKSNKDPKETIFIEEISICNEKQNDCFNTTKLTNQEHFPSVSKLTTSLFIIYFNLKHNNSVFYSLVWFSKTVTTSDHFTETHLAAAACEAEPGGISVCTRRNSST
jgi:hypothetical protein